MGELLLSRVPSVEVLAPTSRALDALEAASFDRHRIALWANHPDPIFRRNRMQLLASAPLLVPVVALPTDSIPNFRRLEIEAAIDRGDQLLDAISRVMAVSQSAAKFFSKLLPTDVGVAWYENPLELLCAVHLTPVVGAHPNLTTPAR